MELLNRINENIGDVKERLTRIEAQEHASSIRELRHEIGHEREARALLELELREIKTRIMPLFVAIAVIAAPVLDWVVHRL